MMVPTKFLPEEIDPLVYVFSFSIGVLIATTTLSGTYFLLHRGRKGSIPRLEVKIALVPGIVQGFLWSAGYLCSIFATKYLGLSVGFALTQNELLFAGLWGIILFGEINRPSAIVLFLFSGSILLGGGAMLVLFG